MSVNGPVSPGDLFVFYGLLKQGASGMPAHIDLDAAGQFGAPCWFRGSLYDLGGFPGVVAGDGLCEGIRYRMTDTSIIGALDEFEDVIPGDPAGSLYERRKLALLDANGVETGELAWIYWYIQPVSSFVAIPSGIWPLNAGRTRKGA
ncbi:MAG: gamma-glutamylcyclotransferase [Hyphomonadaceae bacterium]|nr:gamma-glutamylcyclotransferase [Hyphomonadaceae bacterium]